VVVRKPRVSKWRFTLALVGHNEKISRSAAIGWIDWLCGFLNYD